MGSMVKDLAIDKVVDKWVKEPTYGYSAIKADLKAELLKMDYSIETISEKQWVHMIHAVMFYVIRRK